MGELGLFELSGIVGSSLNVWCCGVCVGGSLWYNWGMYWPFDSRNHPCVYQLWLDWGRVWREEIVCGYRFGIPVCCIARYIFAVYLCLLTKGDSVLLPFLFGGGGWEGFREFDYYRCPLCRLLNRRAMVRWL